MAEAATRPNDELAMRRWGTVFVDPAVEGQYRAWRLEAAVPFNRAGLYLLFGSEALGGAISNALGRKSPAWADSLFAVLMAICVPLTLLSTYRASLRRWMPLLTAVTAGLFGLLITVYQNWDFVYDPKSVTIQAVVGWIVLAVIFGFAIFRLPPIHAVCALTPIVVLASVLYVVESNAGLLPARSLPDVVMYPLFFVIGLAINVLTDIGSRRLFRQERIIEAQKAIIATEHAKNEAALERELGHQVAERSRELGKLLVRAEGDAAALDLSPGARFDARYKIVRALGSGGMGAVYEVERITDGRSLALKIVTSGLPHNDALRFTREAEIGARLRHANLVPIVDVGVTSTGAPFLVMELVHGASLDEHRERFGQAAWAIPILRQIALGIAALHDGGVVHRDLKPGNVLLAGDAEAPLARISDFGISRFDENAIDPLAPTAAMRAQANLTAAGAMIGTPLYMAPEMAQAGRRVDKAVDLFAFGIVAYEMLTARAPFTLPPVLVAMAGQPLATPPPVENAPLPLRDAIMACLAADPSARPTIKNVLGSFS